MIFISKNKLDRYIHNAIEMKLAVRLDEEVEKRMVEFLDFFLEDTTNVDTSEHEYYGFLPHTEDQKRLKRRAVEKISDFVKRHVNRKAFNNTQMILEEINCRAHDPEFIRKIIREINSYQLNGED